MTKSLASAIIAGAALLAYLFIDDQLKISAKARRNRQRAANRKRSEAEGRRTR